MVNQKPSPQRDRDRTRTRILRALGATLARSGFRGVGVNAIAREAGVDKVLIYRYFGGLPELLKAFAEESGFWPQTTELSAGAAGSGVEGAAAVLVEFGRALRRRPLTQEIMRWELLEPNDLTGALARHRDAQGEALISSFPAPEGLDVRAIASLLSAGQTYLALRAKTADVYNGLNLKSPEDWERIERAVAFLVRAAARAAQTPPENR